MGGFRNQIWNDKGGEKNAQCPTGNAQFQRRALLVATVVTCHLVVFCLSELPFAGRTSSSGQWVFSKRPSAGTAGFFKGAADF